MGLPRAFREQSALDTEDTAPQSARRKAQNSDHYSVLNMDCPLPPKAVRPEPVEGPFMVRQAHHERKIKFFLRGLCGSVPSVSKALKPFLASASPASDRD